MRVQGREHIPEDHFYFRSSYEKYADYLEKGQKLKIVRIGESFGWVKYVLGKFWGIAKFDRVDEEPSLEAIQKTGLRHGLLIWIPWKKIPSKEELKSGGWRYLYPSTHFTHTGLGIISEDEYYKSWNERAKRARKKYLAFQESQHLEIKSVSMDVWKHAFLAAKVRVPLRKDFAKFYQDISRYAGQDIQNYLCCRGEEVLGGLSVIFYSESSSMHLLSFLPDTGKKLQVGTGLIDHWYSEGLRRGIKYINFDHLRDTTMARDQQGYTDFKMNFINVELNVKESYFKVF